MSSDGVGRFLRRCAGAGTRGMVWVALGITFLVLGISGSSGAYIGLGSAFLVIGLARLAQRRKHP